MENVETLFLDAGGVLVEPDWARVSAVVARRGIAVAPEGLAAADPVAKRSLDGPAIIDTTDDRRRGGMYYRTVLRRAGVRAADGALEDAVADLVTEHGRSNLWSAIPAGVPEALDRLRAAGIRLVVVSNADGKLRGFFRTLDLERRFDAILDSGALGFEKPDPRIFREALRASGAEAATTVHCGDYFEIDVVGARGAGLRAVLLDPAGVNADRDCPRFPSLGALADSVLGAR